MMMWRVLNSWIEKDADYDVYDNDEDDDDDNNDDDDDVEDDDNDDNEADDNDDNDDADDDDEDVGGEYWYRAGERLDRSEIGSSHTGQ